tara:strand:- start:385 stop:588 length:204 start_codon:yes stop_codon:yes gene_type:complete
MTKNTVGTELIIDSIKNYKVELVRYRSHLDNQQEVVDNIKKCIEYIESYISELEADYKLLTGKISND